MCLDSFSNAILFALTIGPLAVLLSELLIPHVVGERSPEVMRLVRIYLDERLDLSTSHST